MSDIKILLVDDHAVFRMGFKMLIEAEPDMTVIA
jgi:two-component system invasion response regulator UvrY